MDNIILGTAGHIDHGKTRLVKALTGIDTDRLKEEKERGITIELGFAALNLPSGQRIGIVDMPGHEKFVKNMVAGASGIDVVVMVIAADEGVMPQTREHMEICTLMGVCHGMIALTKTDLVDEELLELAMADIHEFVAGSFLEEKPVVPLSSATGQGLAEFSATLEKICAQIPPRKFSAIFRLPVDRVFSMKGFGTVITGTLISGQVDVGQQIMVFPKKITSKVRGLQVHSSAVQTATAGTRTAINFQGLDRESVSRGDLLSTPEALIESYMVDAEFHYLKSNTRPARARTRVRFHSGTSEIPGYMILLDRETLLPGETAPVQFRLESAVCCIKDDRYVIRSYSPVKTIGGGAILNPVARKYRRKECRIIQKLSALSLARDDTQIIECFLSVNGDFGRHSGGCAREYAGLSLKELRVMTNLPDKRLAAALQKMLARQEALLTDRERQIYVHGAVFDELKARVLERLALYHAQNPLKEGMSTQELKSKFQYVNDARFFNILFNRLEKENHIVLEKDLVKLSQFRVALQVDQHEIKEKISAIYKKSGLTPPFFRTICQDLGIDPKTAKDVMQMLIDAKEVVKTRDDLFFDAGAVSDLETRLIEFLNTSGKITTSQFKDLTGISRKYSIPLIEHFDAVHLTIRVENHRQLRKRPGTA